MKTSKQDPRRRDLMQQAVNCWGAAYIFEKKANKYQKTIKFFSLLSFSLPIVTGVTVLAIGYEWAGLQVFLMWIGAISAIQALGNSYLIFQSYDQNLREYLDSAAINKSLSSRFYNLATNINLSEEHFTQEYLLLKGEYTNQANHDEKKQVTPKERRIAGRYGLFRFQLSCASCGKIPKSIKAKLDRCSCTSCGDF